MKQQPAVVAAQGVGCKSADDNDNETLKHMTLSHIPAGCRE